MACRIREFRRLSRLCRLAQSIGRTFKVFQVNAAFGFPHPQLLLRGLVSGERQPGIAVLDGFAIFSEFEECRRQI